MTMCVSEVSWQDGCDDIPDKRLVIFLPGKDLDVNGPDPGTSLPKGLSKDGGGPRSHFPIKTKKGPPPEQAPTHLLLPTSLLPESSPTAYLICTPPPTLTSPSSHPPWFLLFLFFIGSHGLLRYHESYSDVTVTFSSPEEGKPHEGKRRYLLCPLNRSPRTTVISGT